MSDVDYRDPKEAAQKRPALPRFHTVATKMEFKSTQAGRPIFEDREFVEIIIPGQRNSMAVEPVNEEHKGRWPREYAAFKLGMELPSNGTPLATWPHPQMTKSMVENLAFFNVRTVEDVAGLNDAHLQNIGMGAYELRKAAQTFLDVAKNGMAPLSRMLANAERLEAENVRLMQSLLAAKEEIAALEAKVETLKELSRHE